LKSYNRIEYLPETDGFLKQLQLEVNSYFKRSSKSKYANLGFYHKGLFLLTLYISFYFIFLFHSPTVYTLVGYILMGPLAILLGLNVAHDSAHGLASKNKTINSILLRTFDFLGASSHVWKARHVFSHHKYANILNEDSDLKQSSLVRIFPSDEIRKANRYQHIYIPLLFLHYTFNWLLIRDFKDLLERDENGKRKIKCSTSRWFEIVLFKVFYFSYIIIIPLSIADFEMWQILGAYALMNYAAGITITLALVPAHVATTSKFPLPDADGKMAHSWSHHQLITTTDYATDSKVINWMMGGFNHHVAHHLFPNISHVHYKKISPMVIKVAKEHGLTYNYESSLFNAFVSHFKLLKSNGWEAWNTKLNPENQ